MIETTFCDLLKVLSYFKVQFTYILIYIINKTKMWTQPPPPPGIELLGYLKLAKLVESKK